VVPNGSLITTRKKYTLTDKNQIYTVIATFFEPRTAQFNIPAMNEDEARETLLKAGKNMSQFEIIQIVNIKDIDIPEEYEVVIPDKSQLN